MTVADVGYGTLLGGAYVEGTIVLRKSSRLPSDAKVQVLDASRQGRRGLDEGAGEQEEQRRGRRGLHRHEVRLPPRRHPAHRPATLKLVVLQGKKKVASTNVTLAPGLADTHVQDLKVDIKPQDAAGR